jgi:hypothetical protein
LLIAARPGTLMMYKDLRFRDLSKLKKVTSFSPEAPAHLWVPPPAGRAATPSRI